MSKIIVLDDVLINKIAAGEVIERPASVVKELIENSIDADSKKIFIKVIEGGKSLIRVTDDGSGMDEKDAILSLQRHATSKIKNAEDLFRINTLGFRGEALASIAAVSSLELKTNIGKSEGILIEVDSGKIIKEKKVVMPRGTTVIVKDLFKNIPARKKHLKTINTELRKITDIVMRYALYYHDKYIELVHNDKVIINSPIVTDSRNNIASLYGPKVAKKLLSVHLSGDIEIIGEVSKPGYQLNNKNYQSIFVNGRFIKNKVISDAVYEAYHTLLNVNKHPVFFLNIKIDTSKIDVNVHPQKSKIRLENEDKVYESVVSAVKDTLFKDKDIRSAEIIRTTEIDETLDMFKIIKEKQTFIEPEKISKKVVHEFRILGQILKTYMIVSVKEGMLVVDQHAAQERVMYERFLKELDMDVSKQKLLEPIVMELTPGERILINENLSVLEKFGFDVEDFGKNSFLLRSVPLIFGRLQGRDIFLTVLDELKDGKSKKLDKVKEERIIRKACRASVKANAPLEKTELIDVINDLFSTENPSTCPHGRPTMLKFTSDDLEKMFKRKGL